jgi:hypothetical protein
VKDVSTRTSFLFAMPSFMEGFSRVFDVMGTFDGYNVTSPPGDPDKRALAQDWLAIGDDLRGAIGRYSTSA